MRPAGNYVTCTCLGAADGDILEWVVSRPHDDASSSDGAVDGDSSGGQGSVGLWGGQQGASNPLETP